MIGKLVSKNTRTKHQKKVVQLTIDVPYSQAKTELVDGDDLMEFLDVRVGDEIGFDITALDSQDQEALG